MSRKGQFLITKNVISTKFSCEETLTYAHIYHHHALPVYVTDDRQSAILGYAWQTCPDRWSPSEELNTFDGSETRFRTLMETWCGRFVVIYRGTVFTDANALMTVFYSDFGVSSNLGVLADHMELKRQTHVLEPGAILNWYPGPKTMYHSISQLLPFQTYSITTGVVTAYPFPSWKVDPDIAISDFKSYFECSMKNMAATFPNAQILVGLSGGRDSRFVLAMALKAGLPVEAYTLEHPDMPMGDLSVPRRLCHAVEIRHSYIPRGKVMSDKRRRKYIDHVSGTVRDEEINYYAYHQYDDLKSKYEGKELVLLRGGVFNFDGAFFEGFFDLPRDMFYDWIEAGPRESLDEYFDIMGEAMPTGMTKLSRFYIDQRDGGWLAILESGFDLVSGVHSFHPMNCTALMNFALCFPYGMRNKKYEEILAPEMIPEFADIPYAKTDERSSAERHKEKLERFMRRVRLYGLPRAIALYKRLKR